MRTNSLNTIALAVCFLVPSLALATAPAPIPAPGKAEHLLGRRNALVTIIVYTDFECPFCGRQHDTMKRLIRSFRGKVNVIYRHFPLAFHPSAEPAALASECVAKEKVNAAFWQFVDRIFRDGAKTYEEAAEAVGVENATLKTCMAAAATLALVDEDMAGAGGAVTGTPTSFLVNRRTGSGETIVGAQPLEYFKDTINRLLPRK